MKRLIVVTILVLSATVPLGSEAALKLCTWGGTPAAPTGVVTIDRGLTLTPSAEHSAFRATGELAGGGRCTGTMTFTGKVLKGSSCAYASFRGWVTGLKGVARFAGSGVGPIVQEFLYDREGNRVGADQPLLQVPQPDGYSHAQDCATKQGFKRAVFSSTVELWG